MRNGFCISRSGAISRATVALFVVLLLESASASAQELNLSHDLQRLGIAADNMEPNRPDLDQRPLLQAAVDYVRQQHIARVTLDPGDYYFLTTQTNGRYIYLQNLQDVTFAFAGANLYFRDPYALFAMQVVDCQRVTLSGFTVDFVDLPFTQVRVAEVQPSDRTIHFEALPGYRDAADFNDVRTPNGALPQLLGLAFRDGSVVADTGRFDIVRPIAGNTLQAAAANYWNDPATLARILPGDTLVIFGRGAQGTAVRVDNGSDVAFEDVDIYSSNSIALLMVRVTAARVERTRVLPRPGTDRLISSNADGINLTNVQGGSIVRGNEVHRTMDDGIAVNSSYLASVVGSSSPNRLTVQRNANTRFENGLSIALVNAATAEEIGGGRIVSQDPAYETAPVSGGTVQLELDRALPAVPRDSGVVFADRAQRGATTTVENNLVEDVQFARGIYVAGPVGVDVRGNVVRRTTSGGIVLWQAMNVPGFAVPPVHDIQIVGNVVEQPIGLGTIATGSFGALGGICVVSATNGRIATSRVNSNVVIAGNRVADSGRSGIWVTGIAGGSIRDNTIERQNRRPGLPLVGVAQVEQAQLQRDFEQAVVVRNSDGVDAASNTVVP